MLKQKEHLKLQEHLGMGGEIGPTLGAGGI